MRDAIFSLRFRVGIWSEIGPSCRLIREEVFVQEQGVPNDLEDDGRDESAIHVLAILSDGTPVGTGRLLPDSHVGRMATRKSWRGLGVGGAVLALLIEEARVRGTPELVLNAQVSASGFYRKFGFNETGGRFLEAGLAHQAMILRL